MADAVTIVKPAPALEPRVAALEPIPPVVESHPAMLQPIAPKRPVAAGMDSPVPMQPGPTAFPALTPALPPLSSPLQPTAAQLHPAVMPSAVAVEA